MAKNKKSKNDSPIHLTPELYEQELDRLQREMVKLQDWVVAHGKKIVVLFEGRDAAGKGGVIKRMIFRLNPRVCRVVALGKPTERERTQWYFQRYVAHLPAAGEIVLMDRSWYNRAVVERVMGFCTDEEYEDFLEAVPVFERMLIRSGISIVKYWFSISNEEQQKRFRKRIDDPARRWKLSPVDIESLTHWVDFSKAKDAMFERANIDEAPWHVVDADSKKCARLNCMAHFLSLPDYEDIPHPKIKLPRRQEADDYVRPPYDEQNHVPVCYTRGQGDD